jgi:hypothetical protein
MPHRANIRLALTLMFTALTAATAHARIGLVVGEPFGAFGTMMPAGHAAIYLDNLCAASPTQLRPCLTGESGVVLSRYHDLRSTHTDWMAVPAATFFYAIDESQPNPTLPASITASFVSELRESYREAHLRSVAPDRIDRHSIVHRPAYGDWEEAIGAAFDRRLFVYTLETTPAQDAAILATLNTRPNTRRYTLFRANCADFAADLLNTVLPRTFHRNNAADFQMMSPKQLARLIDAYGLSHPEAHITVYEVPQLPGTLRRSRPLRGAAETLLKTKRYLATLLVIQPEALLASWIVYEKKGKWTPGQDATQLSPGQLPTLSALESTTAGTSQPPSSALTSSPSAQASSPPAAPSP